MESGCSALPGETAQNPVQPTATLLLSTVPVRRQIAAASTPIGKNRGHEQSLTCEPAPRPVRTAPASGLDHAGEEATTRRVRVVLPRRQTVSPRARLFKHSNNSYQILGGDIPPLRMANPVEVQRVCFGSDEVWTLPPSASTHNWAEGTGCGRNSSRRADQGLDSRVPHTHTHTKESFDDANLVVEAAQRRAVHGC